MKIEEEITHVKVLHMKIVLLRLSIVREIIGTMYPNYSPYLLEIVWLLLAVISINKF